MKENENELDKGYILRRLFFCVILPLLIVVIIFGLGLWLLTNIDTIIPRPNVVAETQESHSCYILDTEINEFGYIVDFALEKDVAENNKKMPKYRAYVEDYNIFLNCISRLGKKSAVQLTTKTYDNGNIRKTWEFSESDNSSQDEGTN